MISKKKKARKLPKELKPYVRKKREKNIIDSSEDRNPLEAIIRACVFVIDSITL